MKTLIEYLKIGLVAIGKFLKFAYAPEITIGVFGIINLLSGRTLIGLLILTWGILLAVNEYKQNKI